MKVYLVCNGQNEYPYDLVDVDGVGQAAEFVDLADAQEWASQYGMTVIDISHNYSKGA